LIDAGDRGWLDLLGNLLPSLFELPEKILALQFFLIISGPSSGSFFLSKKC